MPLRLKFFLVFCLLTSIPLFILLFGVVDRMEVEIRQRTESELQTTLDKMAGEVELILNSQKSIANGLARVPAVREFASSHALEAYRKNPNLYKQRAEILEQFFINYQHSVTSIQALRFLDNSGKTLVKVKEGKPIVAKLFDEKMKRMYVANQSSRRFFQDALKARQKVIMSNFELGQVVAGADFCPAMVRYSVPIKDELDQVEGVLIVNMWGQRVDKTMEAALGGYPGNAYIVEVSTDAQRDGIYLYHKDSAKRFANQVGSNYRLSAEMTTDEWNNVRTSDAYGSLYKDDGRMFFYRKVTPYPKNDTQWLIVIEVATDFVLAPIRNMRESIWMLLALLLVISLAFAVWAAFQLAKPMQLLASIITRYADGEHSIRYDANAKDEIGFAGRAFNYLVACLEKAEDERDKAERAVCQSERLASIGQLAAGIGHEINNPLMNITSLAGLVEDEIKNKNPQAASDMKLLQTEVKRCANIVQGILNFAKENDPQFKEFDMSELVNETLSLLHHRIETAQIHLVTQVHSPLKMVGDPNMLQQVLVNIILNAIQASPEESNIFISGSVHNEFVVVEILDNGKGIDNNNISKIFDPFFTTKQEGEGTGLGLSVSYGIVKRHGGTINIEKVVPAGVKVSIVLPVKACTQNEEQAKANMPVATGGHSKIGLITNTKDKIGAVYVK
ncbi:hypothetical protein MNBD_GAMMA23-772 [hydrothermal vent metagenome]|uniref:histidine kinase n=1 Tax=hydrothermal vent metagenome TaxID=652676 RepID=A0A3B1ACI2_9ZZZZ